MNSFRIGMNSFRIKLSKGTILPFSFLLQLRLGNWKLCFLILSLHKKFYFLTLFTTPNSSIYPEWFHSGSEWIHSVLEWIHTVPEYIHSGSTFLIVSKVWKCLSLTVAVWTDTVQAIHNLKTLTGIMWLVQKCLAMKRWAGTVTFALHYSCLVALK